MSARVWRPARALGLAFLASVLATAASAADGGAPTLSVSPDSLRADSSGVWHASLRVDNHSEWGLYPDSLVLEWRSLDTEPSAAPREGKTSLDMLIRAMAPAGAGETTGFDWNAPADFVRGSLTFVLSMHDAKKAPHTLRSTIAVVGNDMVDAHPAVLLAAGKGKVEVVDLPATGAASGGGVLYVPPAGVSARMVLRWGAQMAGRGHAVTLVSLPGTGGTTGPADHAGPASVAAVEAALAHLAHRPGVDPKRVAVWGLGDGGSATLLAAARHPELAGVIAQNADYGRPGIAATKITSPVLVLHSAGMGAASTQSAEAFMTARSAKDLPVESRIEGGSSASSAPHPSRDAGRLAGDFLARRLRTP